MNTVFRIIWSHARQSTVVVSELASASGKRSPGKGSSRGIALSAAASVLLLPLQVFADVLPGGGVITNGTGNISSSGNTLTVEQLTDRMVTNWDSFSIGADATVIFDQLSSNSVALNRVSGANPSELLGQLQANGRVYLINPNGVLVGAGAHINTAEFLASALDVSDELFMAGDDLEFSGNSLASVINLGEITAASGDVILIAYQVRNEGSLSAPEGVAALAAGDNIIFRPNADSHILIRAAVAADSNLTGVENSGVIAAAQAELKAAGGSVYDLAINQTGVVRASGSATLNGRVLLTAEAGDLQHSGTISAHNHDGSGGEVLIGDDNSGYGIASTTTVTATAVIDVAATATSGDGGSVQITAQDNTVFDGQINASAGTVGGNGGSAAVTGALALQFGGSANLGATAGDTGTLTITSADQTIGSNAGDLMAGADLANLLTTSNVILDTSHVYAPDTLVSDSSIEINEDVRWSSGNNLTLNSGNDIRINSSLEGAGSTLTLAPGPLINSPGDGINNSADLIVDSSATLTAASVVIKRNTNVEIERSNSNLGPMGNIRIDGTLITDTLDIQTDNRQQYGHTFDEGIAGSVHINNSHNRIGTLTSTVANGVIEGDFALTNGADGLTVDGDFSNISGAISLVTTGNLTLAAGTVIASGADRDIVLAAQSGSFINNAGANAVSATGSGRFLIYSDDPANTVTGGLIGTPVYNKTWADNSPDSITRTGNRFLYSLAPVLTITANAASRSYGDDNPTFTYSISGLVDGDLAADVFTGTASLTTSLNNTSNAGVYSDAITVSLGSILLSDYDYQFAAVAADLTINQALLTVTPIAATRIYGDADPALTGLITGFQNGETEAVLTTGPSYTTTAVLGSNVGRYDIIASAAVADNYAFDYQTGTGLLTVTAAPLIITANDASRRYGDSNPVFSAIFTGLKADDTEADFLTLGFATPDSGVAADVGTYVIRPQGATNANYTYTYVDGALSITPADLTVTASNTAHVYDGLTPDSSTYSATFSGLVAGDLASDYSSQLQFSTSTDGSSTGIFNINVTGISDDNYNVTYEPGTLTISNQILSVIANDLSRLYGEDNPEFTASINGFVDDDDESVLLTAIRYSTVATSGSSVGTYTITPYGASADNYDISFTSGTLTIDPALLTIRANDSSRVYGASDPLFSATYIGLTAGDDASDIHGLSFTTNAVVTSAVDGTYSITPANASNANYTINYESGNLDITPATLTITTNDQSRVYGDSDPQFSVLYSGLVAGDTSTDISGLTISSTASSASDVGRYAINARGASNSNYSIHYVSGWLTVTPASLTISASNVSRTYGDDNPEFTALIDGLVAGDTAEDISHLDFLTSATMQSGVGRYGITPTGAVNSNYNIHYQSGTLTIDPRQLTISADNQSSIFGDRLSAYSLSYDNLASFDTAADIGTVTASGVSGINNNVGSYAISVSGGNNSNYSITRVSGLLTITPRAATVTVINSSREYGDDNADFSVQISNQVSGAGVGIDGLDFTTQASASSDVGSYVVSANGIINNNYDLTYVDGTLSITPATLVFNVNNQSREYGLDNAGLTCTDASGYKLDDSLEDVLSNLSLNTSASSGSNVGSYAITATADVINPNYNVTLNSGTLTITRANLLILPELSSRYYGDADPDFVLTAIGLRNEDTAAVVTGEQFVSSASTEAGVGSYNVSVVAGNASNYNLSFGTGTLNVLPRRLTISADNVSREYGEDNPAFTVSMDGLASFDNEDDIAGVVVNTTATASSGVLDGGYGLTASSSAANANYNITYNSGLLTITPAAISLIVDNATRQYATANPEFSTTLNSDLRLDDTLDDLFLFYNTAANPMSDVGNYAISVSSTNPNYSLNVSNGNLAITPAPLILLLDSDLDLTRTYGDNSIDFSSALNVVGLQFGAQAADVVSVVDPTDATTDIGRYSLQATVLDGNYQLQSFANNSFVIQQRSVDLVFSSVSRVYGEEDSDWRFYLDTTNLLAPGDTLDTVFTAATTGTNIASDVGTYAINISSINSNYRVNSITGELTITARPLAISLTGLERIYGETDARNLGSYINSDLSYGLTTFDPLDTVLDITMPDTSASVGSYNLSASLISSNYTLMGFSGVMTVTPRALVLGISDGYSRVYGEENPDGSLITVYSGDVAGTGLASFDSIDDLLTYSLPDMEADAGRYTITFNRGSRYNNYDIDYGRSLSTTVEITPRTIGLTFFNLDRLYGDANSTLGDLYRIDEVTGVNEAQGVASFDSMDDLLVFSLPGQSAGVGLYSGYYTLQNSNYNIVTLDPGSLNIQARPITLTLTNAVERLYGDANPGSTNEITISGIGLSDFDSLESVIQIAALPDQYADAGTYELVTQINPNYNIRYTSGSDMVITPRTFSIGGNTLYSRYGDGDINAISIGGDGLAENDSLTSLLVLDFLESPDNAGYYNIWGYHLSDNTNYVLDGNIPAVFTILPRAITLDISDQDLGFDYVEELNSFLNNEDLVLDATVGNLPDGEDIDNAFPIIRYQIVSSNQTPSLPTVPTLDTIYIPTAAELFENPALVGSGVILNTSNSESSGISRVPGTYTSTDVGTDGLTLQLYITVFDGYTTESNYVLTDVSNGNITLNVAAASYPPSLDETNNSIDLSGFRLTESDDPAVSRDPLVVSGSDGSSSSSEPGGIQALIAAGNSQLGIDIISSFLQSIMESGETYTYESGSLLAEITRTRGGSIEDVTPFMIQRWLERNADNPEAMTLLAEPLAYYSKEFLSKDPATYTGSETVFSDFLAEHLESARDDIVDNARQNHDDWLTARQTNGSNMTDTLGADVPWDTFMSEAAGDYLVDDVGERIATTTAIAGGAGATTALVVGGLTSFIMPFASGAAGMVSTASVSVFAGVNAAVSVGGVVEGGAAIAAEASIFTGATGAGLVAIPVTIVITAVVGSIARGIEVFDNLEQEKQFDTLIASRGDSITTSQFSVTDSEGEEDVLNSTIMVGALASMLYPG
jgi:filamentous hemagglutinin family protein